MLVCFLGEKQMGHGHGHERTPNDQRSDAKNPTSQEHKDTMDNRSNQIRENKEEKNHASGDDEWENVEEHEHAPSSMYTPLPHQHECKYWVDLQCLKGHKALGSNQPVTWESGCPSDCPDFCVGT
jgi:hypothetical protein